MLGVVFERLQEMLKGFKCYLGRRLDQVEVAQPDIKTIVSLEPVEYLGIPYIELPDFALDPGPQVNKFLSGISDRFCRFLRSEDLTREKIVGGFAVGWRQQCSPRRYLGISLDFCQRIRACQVQDICYFVKAPGLYGLFYKF